MPSFDLFASAARNLETLLADELRTLGAEDVAEVRAGVRFRGTLATAYRVCLWSRLASRVLLQLAEFPARDTDELYAGAREIPWAVHLDAQRTFAVQCDTVRSAIDHSHFAALRVKDAIVDALRDEQGLRPSVRPVRPDVKINVHIARDVVSLSLDLSGEALHRRGYRAAAGAAPLKETLAAAVLLRAGWPGIAGAGGALVDPMCGSGTLLVEGALMAADSAPGLGRDYWGFGGWKRHAGDEWDELLAQATARRERGLASLPPIRGYDNDASMVSTALDNVERAGLAGRIHVERREVSGCEPPPRVESGLLVVNPPYGERLGDEQALAGLYASLGTAMAQRFSGWRAAVLTGNPRLGREIGLRAVRTHALYNGLIPCKLLHFVVEEGARRDARPAPKLPAPDEWSAGAVMLANRLAKNLRHLGKWRRRERVECYRLYDSDLPEFALAVDVYEGEQRWVHVQEYKAPGSVDPDKAKIRGREGRAVVLDALDVPSAQCFYKVRRRQRGASQYEKLDEAGRFHEVREGGARFLVNFEDYLDTGLFLDHRITRRMLGEMASGKRFLNLFAYTGTASVCAALGGAIATTTVDMSSTYLEWARRNMALNGFTGPAHRFLREDCVAWLEQSGPEACYDLIFVDPPSFSNSRRMRHEFDVQRDHASLIKRAAALLAPGGVLVFSTNLRSFRLDESVSAIFRVKDLTRATLPKDFERNPKVHRCWRIERGPAA